MKYRDAVTSDIEQIESLLKEYSLPVNDIFENINNFVIAEQDNKIVGLGGFEKHGEIILLRSITVTQEYRGKAIGKSIYQLLESKISRLGINQLYLLTETATDYFKNIGFTIKERIDVPEAVMRTKQFNELCPSTAVVMFYELDINNVYKGSNK